MLEVPIRTDIPRCIFNYLLWNIMDTFITHLNELGGLARKTRGNLWYRNYHETKIGLH